MANFKERFQNHWKTTILGLVAMLLTVLVTVGVLTPEQGSELTTGSTGLAEHIEAIVAIIAGIVLVFTKDPDKD